MERYVYVYLDEEGILQWTADVTEAEEFSITTFYQIEVIYEAV